MSHNNPISANFQPILFRCGAEETKIPIKMLVKTDANAWRNVILNWRNFEMTKVSLGFEFFLGETT